MPLSAHDLDVLFTYHPPTDEQKPKYAAITEKERSLRDRWDAVEPGTVTHDDINRELREFVELIDTHCPDSADKAAAIRCVRVARNGLNEALVLWSKDQPFEAQWCWDIAFAELRKARWQANSAIALFGK
jgi:hypothetical protein